MNKKINAEIIADSIDERGNRITSYILTVPQIIVKELLRHRMFSFSSSSMRAIPFNKVLEDIRENMFVPLAFQSHHSGMQGSEYLMGEESEKAKQQWIESGLRACEEAERLYNLGVTKQLCSRIIEPFGYAKILVTATEFDNFFELRCPKYDTEYGIFKSKKDVLKADVANYNEVAIFNPGKPNKLSYNDLPNLDWLQLNLSQAEIHIQALAEAMWDAKNESTPKKLNAGEWHIPFSDKMNTSGDDADNLWQAIKDNHPRGVYEYFTTPYEVFVATARCARLSYITFDGDIDYDKDIKLHNQLLESKHASPMEHCAQCQNNDIWYANFKGWKSYRKILEETKYL